MTAYLFNQHMLSATTLTVCWAVAFFFASAGASAAYLTVSEIFPMETRAMAIALFYACGTGVAIAAPWTFGKLIETGSYGNVTIAFVIGGVIMALGGDRRDPARRRGGGEVARGGRAADQRRAAPRGGVAAARAR